MPEVLDQFCAGPEGEAANMGETALCTLNPK